MPRFRFLVPMIGALGLWLIAVPALAQCIPILEAVRGVNCIPARTGFGAFFLYVGLLYPWLVGTAGGVALLWAVIGGLIMMQAGGDQAKYDDGKKKILYAILGLMIILFSAMIMNILNPTFYR